MSDELRFKVLGRPQISRNGTPLTGFVSSKATALLLYLAITGGVHQRESLAGLFWGDSSEEDARASLRVVLSNLRQTVGREYFATTRTTVAFNEDRPYWLDINVFEAHARPGDAPQDDVILSWRRAVELYEGDLFDGLTVSNAPHFEEWLIARREHLRQLALAALSGLAGAAAEDAGDPSATIGYLTRLLALDPWREDALRRLMTLLARDGRRNDALLQYERCRQLLDSELGVEPEPETTTLYASILSGELQAAPDREPPARRATDTAPAGDLVPAVGPHTTFIGREPELHQIISRLRDPACRLISLTGPGGVGKSRLAMQVSADRRLGFRDGVHIVPLASVSTPEFIAPAIAAVIGANIAGSDDPRRQLLRFLQDRSLLLVLDNFEHLVEGASLVNDILDAAPDVKLLVTSRERLALQAEWLLPIQGLPVPDALAGSVAATSPAARLFVERARRAQPDFAPADETLASVIHICRLLDGMPLGIELAAAWTRTHTCAEIAAQVAEDLDFLTAPMRDVPERHHSLRAVFMHSWALLDRRSQAILQALSVFRGGCLDTAAEAVAGASLRDLADLVDKSLLYRETSGRYALHELVRQYAFAQLAASPAPAQAHRRHAAFFADLLHASEALLKSNAQLDAVQRILADIDNVRAAWQWAVAHNDFAIQARALDGLQIFIEISGRLREGTETLERATAAIETFEPDTGPQAAERDLLYGRLLGWLSRDRMGHGRFTESKALLERSRALLAGHDAEHMLAYALDTEAMYTNAQGRQDEALRLQQAALLASEASGDRIGMALAFRGMGGIAFDLGNFPEARRWFARGLKVRRELRDWDNIVRELGRVGLVARLLGDYREAQLRAEEALAIQRERGSLARAVLPLRTLGKVFLDVGRLARAEQLIRQAHEITVRLSLNTAYVDTEGDLALLMLCRGEPEAAQATIDAALAIARRNANTIGIMRCMAIQARVAAHVGKWQEAQDVGNEVLRISTAAGNLYQIGRTEILLGRAAIALGDLAQAGQLLESAHTRLERAGTRPALLDAVASEAELYMAIADAEEQAQRARDRRDQADELLDSVLHDPATWFETRQRAARLQTTLVG